MNKKEFRSQALAKLRSIPKLRRYIIDKRANAELYSIIKSRGAKIVMLYIPLELEVDIMPLIGALRRENVLVLVPFMEGDSFRLVKYRLPLSVKRYGVKEPNNSKKFRKKIVDISIVPIVGLDASLRRIGFGKGMYDRFFTKEKHHITETIFIQRALCFTEEIITDDFDVRADLVI